VEYRQGMKLTFDVDDCLTQHTPYPDYDNAIPCSHALFVVNYLYKLGYSINYLTARWMNRCENNQAKATEMGYRQLEGWLNQHGFPPGNIFFGKPGSEIYADDKAYKINIKDRAGSWYELMNLLPRPNDCFKGILSECPNVCFDEIERNL
jgi:hypothetical protein